jgi:hypothetical protein
MTGKWAQVMFALGVAGLLAGWWAQQSGRRSANPVEEAPPGPVAAVPDEGPGGAEEPPPAPEPGPEQPPEGTVSDGAEAVLELERREAREAVVRLAEENAGLRKEVLELSEQVRKLAASLASERERADQLKVRLERVELGAASADLAAGDLLSEAFPLVDSNEELRMVVLDAGQAEGIRNGMTFAILRGDEAVARARVVDVREHLAGAMVEDLNVERFPGPGDRAVAWSASRGQP